MYSWVTIRTQLVTLKTWSQMARHLKTTCFKAQADKPNLKTWVPKTPADSNSPHVQTLKNRVNRSKLMYLPTSTWHFTCLPFSVPKPHSSPRYSCSTDFGFVVEMLHVCFPPNKSNQTGVKHTVNQGFKAKGSNNTHMMQWALEQKHAKKIEQHRKHTTRKRTLPHRQYVHTKKLSNFRYLGCKPSASREQCTTFRLQHLSQMHCDCMKRAL